MVSYTWSKWLTDSESGHSWYDRSGMDQYNHKLEKSVSTTDVPQNLTLSYVYELPIGKDKPLKTTGVANAIVGGWQISGTQRYQSGYPLGVGVANTLPIFSGQRPVCLAGANPRGTWTGDPATEHLRQRDRLCCACAVCLWQLRDRPSPVCAAGPSSTRISPYPNTSDTGSVWMPNSGSKHSMPSTG